MTWDTGSSIQRQPQKQNIQTITISFTASETELPEVYTGKIVIRANEIEKNVIIDVKFSKRIGRPFKKK